MTDNEIMKALECCISEHLGCGNCPLEFDGNCGVVLRNGCINLINQYEAEIESLEVEKLHIAEFLVESERKVKDLEVELKAMRGAANSYKVELEHAQAEIERLQHSPIIAKLCPMWKAEAIREFAKRLCKDRVSNDPVVIAVKSELKEMVGEENGC